MLMGATHVPAVQTFLGEKAAQAVAQQLGTKVDIERVDLGFLNRIIIDNVLVHDQHGKKMLHIGRLSARIDLLPLTKGQLRISSAQLFGTHAWLYKTDANTPANFQFVIDSLASSDTTTHTPLDLRIGSFIMRHSSISYNRHDCPIMHQQFDPNHLHAKDISAHIILKTLTDDSINVNVKRLAFSEERSRLSVDRLSFLLNAGTRRAKLEEFTLQLPHSSLCIDSLSATYDDQRIKETLAYKGSIGKSSITLSELGCFISALKDRSETISLWANIEGTATSIQIPRLSIRNAEETISLRAQGWAKALDQPHPIWHAELNNLTLSAEAMSALQKSIEAIPEPISRIGQLNANGSFDGYADGNIATNSRLLTDVGNVSVQFTLSHNNDFNGHIDTDGIDLQRLLGNEAFGMLATTIDVSGNKQLLAAKGHISQLHYNNYEYRDIELDGNYQQGHIAGKLKIDDPNIQTHVEGEILKNTSQATTLRLTGNIRNLSPQKLNLSSQWGNASFSAIVDADITASNLNDAEGTIDLDDFVMTDSLGSFHLDNVHLKSGYDEDVHYLKLSGDMGEAQLKGQFDWDTLPLSFVSYVASKLPTLPGLPAIRKAPTNNFAIQLSLSNTQWLRHIFGIPLTLERPLSLQGSINDLTHNINVEGHIPAFTYADTPYRDGHISITSPADTMLCDVRLAKLMENGRKMDVHLATRAAENSLSSRLSWNNNAPSTDHAMSGQLNATTQLYKNMQGKPEAHLRVLPSHILLGGAQWDVAPGDIVYSDKHLTADHFSVEHGQQHLTINGIASASPHDTITVDLQGIEVAYILDLVDFHSVEFSGEATGQAHVTQLFGTPEVWTKLSVNDFRFENGRMGTLHAHATWNQKEERIDIDAVADDGPLSQTPVHGYVSPTHNYIDLDIQARGSSIEFMNSFTSAFLSNMNGQAHGAVKLAGPLDAINLTGQLVVDGQATVTALGTTYTLEKDTVDFIPNDIVLHSIPLKDRYGNTAYMSGGIHHDCLTNLTFDLDVSTQQLLAYDFSDFGDNSFYGTVFVSATADLHGRPGEVVINCNATPLPQSTFTYNAASADAISQQEFIMWKEKAQHASSPAPFQSKATGEAGDETPSDLYMNLTVNATPDAQVRLLMDPRTGDYITLYGSGIIRTAYHNNGAFHMFGTYTVNTGTYDITIQNIIKKNFTFQEGGTIVFGGNPMDANLQLQAIYTVNGVSLSDLNIGNSFSNNTIRVNCLMNILGQAAAPQVEFDLDLPTVNSEERQMIRSVIASEQETNQQVLYLLGIGRFYTQGTNNAAAQQQQYDQTSLAMQSFLSGTLSTQINEVLSQVIKNDQWNFGANISTGNEGWHNAEYEGLVSGRMLNNRLLINGQFGYRDNATQATPSFIGDFDIRYLLYPNGNLALKVYNQTNDRYFTHSSLNTQGIGLIMKRDFNGLGDLFRTRKKKTKNP